MASDQDTPPFTVIQGGAGPDSGTEAAPQPSNIEALAAETSVVPSKETAAEHLVRIAITEMELFHDDNEGTFASAVLNGHRETWPLRSRGTKEFLARRFYAETQRVLGGQALEDALKVLCGRALNDGPEKKTFVRVGHMGDSIYLDLADVSRRVIEIRGGAWSYCMDPPVRFRRPRGMGALPAPEPGGTLDELKQFVNVPAPSSWCLVLVWMAAVFFPGPFTWLAFLGRQGSAKTTSARFLRRVIDPNKSPVRAPPRKVRDLIIGAQNSVIMVFDNLSYLTDELSDALCRLSTGGGLSSRELYTDLDEVIVEVQRAGVLTAITDVVARADLLDRCILMELPPLHGKRKTERQLERAFKEASPRILGALLDTVAAVQAQLPHVELEEPPRMADFAHVGVAAERALGWPAGRFLSCYEEAIAAATDVALDVSVIVPFLRKLADAEGFEGTAAELLDVLNDMLDGRWTWPPPQFGSPVGQRKARPDGWPKSPRSLSAQMRRLEPSLLSKGVAVTFRQTHGEASRKIIAVRRVDSAAASTSGSTAVSAPSTRASQASQFDGSGLEAVTAPTPDAQNPRDVCQ